MAEINWWVTAMDETTARRVLGSKHFDWAISQGHNYINRRLRGCWDAILPESHAAYRCALKFLEPTP